MIREQRETAITEGLRALRQEAAWHVGHAASDLGKATNWGSIQRDLLKAEKRRWARILRETEALEELVRVERARSAEAKASFAAHLPGPEREAAIAGTGALAALLEEP